MAKQPRFVRDQGGNWKIAGYFESGRYHFTLSEAARRLLQQDLGYYVGDPVPLEFFRTLVYAGDAWLPSFPEEPVEAGDDLVEPPAPDTMTDEEAEALAEHLRGRRVGERQRAALQDQIDRTPLGRHLTAASLQVTDDWVEHLPAMTEGDADDGADDGQTESGVAQTESGAGQTGSSGSVDAVSEPVEATGDAGSEPAAESDATTVPPPTNGHDGVPAPEDRSAVESASVSYLAELESAGPPGFERFSTERLVDTYALLSEIESRIGDVRTEVRDVLAARVESGREVSGRLGTVKGASRTRRSLKDEQDVFEALERHGLPREAVLGMQVDEDQVENLVEKADVEESDFFDVSETDYVRRIDVDVSRVERLASGSDESGEGGSGSGNHD